MAELLMDFLGLDEKAGLDRAHHTLRAKPKEGKPPRLMVIRVIISSREYYLKQVYSKGVCLKDAICNY